MPDIDTVQNWQGRTMVDPAGDKLGTIDAIYLDDDTGQPEWATVTTGLFGTKATFVPLAQAQAMGDSVQVPYDKQRVKDAPNMQAGVGAGLGVVQAVVAVQLGLLALGQLPVSLHAGGGLDLVPVVGHLDAAARGLGLGEWHEGGLGGEQAAGDRGPLGLTGLVIQVDGVDRAELVAGRVHHGAALPALNGVDAWWHARPLPWCVMTGWRTGRLGPVSCRGVPPSWTT